MSSISFMECIIKHPHQEKKTVFGLCYINTHCPKNPFSKDFLAFRGLAVCVRSKNLLVISSVFLGEYFFMFILDDKQNLSYATANYAGNLLD